MKKQKSKQQVVLGGFGGQGIIMAGLILGKAAAIFAGKHATFTQDYGPEARGGACRAQVIIDEQEITYPYVENPDVVAVMSQEAYTKYTAGIWPEAVVLTDAELVKANPALPNPVYSIAATRLATELGRAAVANIVMLGFVSAVTGVLPVKAVKDAVLDTVPAGTGELNMKAFQAGYDYGKEQLAGGGG